MIDASSLLNYGTIVFTVAGTSLGTAIGQGLASYAALQALNIQPMARNEITRTLVLALALMETAAVIGIALAILLLIDPSIKQPVLAASIGRCGIALAMSLTGLAIGIASSLPTRSACMAIARQPFFSKNIVNLLLIAQSLLQTPILFGFIISWIIKTQAVSVTSLFDGWRLIASGLVMGLGSIGPVIGLGLFAQAAVQGVGVNRKSYTKMLTFTFISEAIIETPILFSFIVGLIILFSPITPQDNFVRGIIMLAAALCTGLSTIMPGINSGRIAGAAGKELALHPDQYSILSRTSMLGQALLDTFVLYAALISFLMILVTR